MLANRQQSGGGLNSGLSLNLPLLTTVAPISSAGSSTATFTRATAATVFDWESLLKTPISGEVRFQGARRVRNYCQTAVNTWNTIGASMTITGGVADPAGGASAYTLTAGAAAQYAAQVFNGIVSGTQIVNSIWIRRRTGTGDILLYDGGDVNATTSIQAVVTSAWQRISVGVRTAAGAGSNDIGIQLIISGDAVDVWQAQFEQITGQSNQNPGEYVSVGVLSSPYHGAMVDGVRYFSTTNGNTVV